MRLPSLLSLLLASSSLVVSAASLSTFGQDQRPLDDGLAVPGDSPLEYCTPDRDAELLIIEKVDLSPNPPRAGQPLLITALGQFKDIIEEGAYVQLSVKYGLVRLISMKTDLCEQVKNVDLECPIPEGKQEIKKEVEMPKEIPPGKYTVLADVYTKDGRRVTCLTAQVQFSREGMVML